MRVRAYAKSRKSWGIVIESSLLPTVAEGPSPSVFKIFTYSVHAVRCEIPGRAPFDSPTSEKEVAAAANFPPHGWEEGDRSVSMITDPPTRSGVVMKTHVQRLATAAGTE